MFSSITMPLLLTLLLPLQEGTTPPEEEWNDETCQEVMIWDLDAGKVSGEIKVYVDIKYGDRLRYVTDPVSTVRFVPRDWDPKEILRGFKRGDNVRFYGKFTGPPNEAAGTFDFHWLKRLKGDDDQFAELRNQLKGGDVDGMLELGNWARERHEFYKSHAKSLGEKAIQIYEEAVGILEKEEPADPFQHHFRIARILHERMDQRDRALTKLKETCLLQRPEDPELVAYLKEKIRAVQYRDDWVPYEEFKAQEGFTQRVDGTWVREPVLLLEQFVTEKMGQPQAVPDNRAEAGDVVRGMTATQVLRGRFVRTQGSSAYPDFILRAPIPAGGTAEIWVYPDSYLLFRTTVLGEIARLWKSPVPRR